MFYHYTHALVRGLPATFEDSLKLEPPPVPIDIAKAHEQHEDYTRLVLELVPLVIDVPADDACPDCVFIEDSIIIIDEVAVLCRSGAPSRRPEVEPVAEAVRTQLGMACVRIEEPGTLDGGDVMFTGFEIIVGLTKRSNAAAVDQLTQHFEGKFPVRGVEVPRGDTCLHLKSLMSAFDEKTILVADNAAGRAIAEKIRAHAHTPELYELVYVPDMLCANVLRIHDTLVVQDGYPASEAVLGKLCEERGVTMMKLCMSELAKADGALTCCSVLIKIT